MSIVPHQMNLTELSTFRLFPKTLYKLINYLCISGDEDRVRCFMCGGGLSAWEDGDIPLYEHHRWFGNCPYVRECRKNAVVAAILETAEHIHVCYIIIFNSKLI